ncbi:hypothetical protein RB594_005196 [Gaeumannomyces avenae]
MDSTPPLTRSPASPPNSYSSSAGYPSPDLVAQHYRLSAIEPACSMAPPLDPDSAVPPLENMGQSAWAHNSMLPSPSTGATMPSIVSSEYNGFVTYDNGSVPGAHAYGGHQEVYGSHGHHHHQHQHHHHHHQHLEPAMSSHSSPRPSSTSPGMPPARGAMTFQPVVPLSQPLTPRIKMEAAQPDYVHGADYPSPRSIHVPYSSEVGSYSAAPSSGYLSDTQSSAWSKDYSHSAEPDSFYSVASGQALGIMGGDRRAAHMRAQRPRVRKRLTTKEEANFQCEVKGCEKLFSRSYNFKAHMETHDSNREYPFPCGECSKKFVRKTDLQRHHQSVHMKERNHKCDFCGRLFARKDTLRRHMEDGCSRRFDITLPPMSIPSMGNGPMLDTSSASLRARGTLQNGEGNPDDPGVARFRQGWGLV